MKLQDVTPSSSAKNPTRNITLFIVTSLLYDIRLPVGTSLSRLLNTRLSESYDMYDGRV